MRHITRTLLVVLVLAVPGLGAQSTDSPQALLRIAQDTAVVDGDLNTAIAQYQTIVETFETDREVVATALVRMARLYEKLGAPEARTAYSLVLSDYADQPEAVAIARARLDAVAARTEVARSRVVWAGREVFSDGRVSPDGRLISYDEWWETGNLMLHDVAAGTNRPLSGNKDWSVGNAYTSTFSPDGKELAYGWRSYTEPTFTNEIRIVRVDGNGIPQPRRVFGSDDMDFIYPLDWSRDGKWLAVHVIRRDRSAQIGLVEVESGSFRALRSVGWRRPKKIFFSPDGKYLAYDLPASDSAAQRDVFVMAVDGSRETAVVKNPAHDVVMGWSPDGGRLLFASDRTGLVGLWAVPLDAGRPQGPPVLLKPDIGSVQSIGLTSSGSLYLVKEASTESLQVAPIDLQAGTLSGPPVLENFQSEFPDWSPDGKYLAYVSKDVNGNNVLSIRDVQTGHLRTVHPQIQYINRPRWLPDARALLTDGRDFKGRFGIYRIDAQDGATSLIAPDVMSRVQVSPDGTKIYYRTSLPPHRAGTIITERDIASGETRELSGPEVIGELFLSPDGRLLATIVTDDVAKTSALQVVPVAGGEAWQLLPVKPPERLATHLNMSWTPDSRAVIVGKSRCGFPKGPQNSCEELWLVPVNGDAARKLDVDTSGWAQYAFQLHPNGRQIAFFTGQSSREVWALENILTGQEASQ